MDQPINRGSTQTNPKGSRAKRFGLKKFKFFRIKNIIILIL